MDFWMVVQINAEDGTFEQEPEFFDTRQEAEKHHKWLIESHGDLTFALVRCTEEKNRSVK